eukprot:8723328-Pyramimonas_sp.AAC.1
MQPTGNKQLSPNQNKDTEQTATLQTCTQLKYPNDVGRGMASIMATFRHARRLSGKPTGLGGATLYDYMRLGKNANRGSDIRGGGRSPPWLISIAEQRGNAPR